MLEKNFIKNVLVIFGTRPEAIKMCPLINELKSRDSFNVIVCVTGQHKQMLKQVLDSFDIIPDYDLNIMKDNQDLFDITNNILNNIKKVVIDVQPDIVLVHGDTSTTFAASLACFYLKVPIGHVEAGLRTHNIFSPYPEEFNRQAVSLISKFNFAPTKNAAFNLINEGKDSKSIFITGNTVIDAMKYTVKENYYHPELEWVKGSKLILITAHRRENLGKPMQQMFRAIRRVLNEHKECKAIYPIHLNPQVRKIAKQELVNCDNIHIIEPVDVVSCHNFEARAYICLTDSGGLQEECPSYGVPVLVMRDTTERPEGLEAGTLKLVGTCEENIYKNFKLLLEDEKEYAKMSNAVNPYGDGNASKRIVDVLQYGYCESWC